jgi:hypothetical protein
MFKEIIAVHDEIHTKRNGKNAESVILKVGGTYRYHSDTKGYG